MDKPRVSPNGYDVFISHNHADKAWARELAARLANVDYRGRPLRPCLDEQVLDPGELGGDAELTSALDRSRALLIVLSAASVASRWVTFEVEYFQRERRQGLVAAVVTSACDVPALLAAATRHDFTDSARVEQAFALLVDQLCPAGGPGVGDAEASVDAAWTAAVAADPGGFDAEPSPERDALLAAVLRFSIEDPATEGLALAGFSRAARQLLANHQERHPAAYNMKMLLGECLAVAVQHHARYRQVAQQYLALESADGQELVLPFVVLRACSKLAELDPLLVDLGALLRIAAHLDARGIPDGETAALALLLGRIAAKLRGTDVGDLLIRTLSEGGAAGRIAAIAAIAVSDEHAPPVFYLSELERLQAIRRTGARAGLQPPSRKLQALLFGIDLDQPPLVRRQLEIAKDDLRRAFGIDDLPYGYTWLALRREPPVLRAHLAPFIGTVMKATTANMEDLALRVQASDVVCLTQPRIVDALFERAGSLLIEVQDESSPQSRRLIGRGVPFATLDAERMARLKDGDCVQIQEDRTRVVVKR